MISRSAPGKVILLGEHAVVYGRPAIAVPVGEVSATASITVAEKGSGCTIHAPQIGMRTGLAEADAEDPLALITRLTLDHCHLPPDPDWRIDLYSEIPIASGMGSGAAISSALVLAIHSQAGLPVAPAVVSRLVFESERLYHGTPSGIDNTVIAYGHPVWFVKGRAPVVFSSGAPFTLAIADSGIAAPTREVVADVRRAWQTDPDRYEALFDSIGDTVLLARQAIEKGNTAQLGSLFDRNQSLLARIGVSSLHLDRLVDAARGAGALGAKLSGGGRGGNIIALVDKTNSESIQDALLGAGARRVITTTVTT